MMKYKSLFIFIAGLGTGALGMYIGVKKHYENLADEEIESVKEYYLDFIKNYKKGIVDDENEKYADEAAIEAFLNGQRTVKEAEEAKDTEENDDQEPEQEPDYDDIIQKLNYNQYSYKNKEKKKKEAGQEETKKNEVPPPYMISPDDYINEDNGFDKVVLTYFLEDENFMNMQEELVDAGAELVGSANLDCFGQYEDNTLYVRNEKFGADYEIILNEEHTYESYMLDSQ